MQNKKNITNKNPKAYDITGKWVYWDKNGKPNQIKINSIDKVKKKFGR